MLTKNRRYDIDWVRVIAIGLLLIYHTAIAFQPWGVMIGFITTEKTWGSLWIPMSMLNVWRIPLLFFVSGMGVYFAIQNRDWKALLKERASRILLPFVFGVFVIVPIHLYLWRYHNDMQLIYSWNPGHLWFLGNIFVYVVVLTPLFFYLKNNASGKLGYFIKKIFNHPAGLLLLPLVFSLEALALKPYPYELYAMTWHGFFLGLLAFLFGFCFVLSGDGFWNMLLKYRWLFISVAIVLYVLRVTYFNMNAPVYLLVTESNSWILSVFAFAYKFLNRENSALSYLSQAAYPVYILHMIFLYLGSMLVFQFDLPAQSQFILVLAFTVAGCFFSYELIRRTKFLRPLFGLKIQEEKRLELKTEPIRNL